MLSIEASRVVDCHLYGVETLSSVADFEFTIYEPPKLESVTVTLQGDPVCQAHLGWWM